MKRIITLMMLIALSHLVRAQQTFWTPGVPTGSTSFAPTFRTKAGTTDSLAHLYISNGNKWYETYTAAVQNSLYLKLLAQFQQTQTQSFPSTTGTKIGVLFKQTGTASSDNQNFYGIDVDNQVALGGHTGVSIWSARFHQSTQFLKSIYVASDVNGRYWQIPRNDTLVGYIPYFSIKDTTKTPIAKFHGRTGDFTLGRGIDTIDMVGHTSWIRANGIRLESIASTGAVSGLGIDGNGDVVKTGGAPGSLTSITPGIGFTNHTPITSSGTMNVDTVSTVATKYAVNHTNWTFVGTQTFANIVTNAFEVGSSSFQWHNPSVQTSFGSNAHLLFQNVGVGDNLKELPVDSVANYMFNKNEVYDVFIFEGQSNTKGSGNYLQSPAPVPGNLYYNAGALHPATNPIYGYLAPSVYKGDMMTSFGNTHYQLTGRHSIVINLAVASTALLHQNDSGAGHWDWTGTSLGTSTVARMVTFLDSLRILGVRIGDLSHVWGQGEEDGYPIYQGITSNANMYRDTLISLFKRFRAATKPTAHCYIIRTGAWNNPPDPDYYITVRNAQESVPAKDSLAFVIARDAVEFPALGFMGSSTVHWNQNGQNDIGRQAAIDIQQNLHKTAYFLGDMIYFDGVRMGRNSKLQFDSVYKAIHLGVLPTVPSMDTVSVTSAGRNAGIVIERFGTGGSNSGRISFFNSRGTSSTSALPIQAGDYLGGFLVYGNYGTGTATYNAAASVGLRGIAVDNFTSGAMGAGLVATVIPIGTTTPVTALNIYPAGGTYFANAAMSSIAIQTHLFAKNSGVDSASSVFDGGTVPASMWRNNTYYNYNRVTMFMNSNTDATLDATLALKINTTNNAPITLGSGQLAIKSTVTAGVLHSAVTTGNITTGQVQSADIASGAVSLTKIANQPANTIIGNNTGSSASLAALTVSQINTMLGFSTTLAQTYTFPTTSQTLASLAGTETITNKTITSSTNKIGGVTMQLGSDATGDIHYSGASNVLTRLGIGSTGQVLGVSAGVPAWQTASITQAAADLTAQTAAGNITTFTVGAATATFNISAYLNVTAVVTDVIQVQVTYTDENSNSQTISYTTLNSVSDSNYNPVTIRAKNATVITVKTNLTTGIGSITFDAGARITQL